MTEPLSLFPDLEPVVAIPVEVEEKLSAGRRLTLRQKADIAAGRHPLMTGLRLAGNGETCGSCINRTPSSGSHSWPKCSLHVTGGPASDCRAWWPGCTAWTAKPLTVRKVAAVPKRIQRKRTAGWRMPEGAIYVGRPGRYGNPYIVGDLYNGGGNIGQGEAVDLFRRALLECRLQFVVAEVRRVLRGHDLACWCKPGDPCHADVLLELANR